MKAEPGPVADAQPVPATLVADGERDAEVGVAGRVARNSGVRAAGELVGKLFTLALMALLARREGPAGLGVFVFALAWAELSTTLMGPGLDPVLVRRLARDRSELDRSFANLVLLKLQFAVGVTAASLTLLVVLDLSAETRAVIVLMSIAFLLDALSISIFSVFQALERGDLVGLTLMAQRMTAGLFGVGVLLLGEGVVAIAAVYVVAAVGALALGVALLVRRFGRPALTFPREPRRRLRRESYEISLQELVAVGITRVDAILISAFAGPAVVGIYGAAYRLLEATLFISAALKGAFAAMYAYLGEATQPTIGTVVGKSLKLSLTLLVPCAVPLVVLPGAILELLFGAGFAAGDHALRLLGCTVVVLGIAFLADAVIVVRLNPRILLRFFALALLFNAVANVLLIPAYGATGAAAAMLGTEVLLAGLMGGLIWRRVGRFGLVDTVCPALVAGMAMAATLAIVPAGLLPALVVGAVAYLVVLVAVEGVLAPEDLEFVRSRIAQRRGRG